MSFIQPSLTTVPPEPPRSVSSLAHYHAVRPVFSHYKQQPTDSAVAQPKRTNRQELDASTIERVLERPTARACIRWQRGHCSWGDRCCFAHTELGAPPETAEAARYHLTRKPSNELVDPKPPRPPVINSTHSVTDLQETVSLVQIPSLKSDCAEVASSVNARLSEPKSATTKLRRCEDSALCGICLTSVVEEQDLTQPCVNTGCTAAFHRDCISEYFQRTIESSRYCCPQMLCPGTECRSRIPTNVWRRFVHNSDYKLFSSNTKAIMSIRCEWCDEQNSLYYEGDVTEQEKIVLRDDLVKAVEQHSFGDVTTVLKSLEEYNNGAICVEEMADALFDNLSSEEPVDSVDEDLYEPHPVIEHMIGPLDQPGVVPGLICDLERRAALQLECFRRFPFVQTQCCAGPLCFKCKTMYHHPGETCEEIVKREVGDGSVQCCPSCGVPTMKVEACDSIQCVCGEIWDWDPSLASL